MRWFFLNPKAVIAILGLLWSAKVIKDLPSDWETFRDSDDRTDQTIQIVSWIVSTMVVIITVTIVFSILSFSISELKDWSRF